MEQIPQPLLERIPVVEPTYPIALRERIEKAVGWVKEGNAHFVNGILDDVQRQLVMHIANGPSTVWLRSTARLAERIEEIKSFTPE